MVKATDIISPKSRLVAALLVFFLGFLVLHRFYRDKTGTAAMMFALAIVGLLILWLFIGLVLLMPMYVRALLYFIITVFGNM